MSFGNLNKVILIGNVGQDPEVRETNKGTKIARFSIATTMQWAHKDTKEKQTKTEWHRICVMNKFFVKLCEDHITKGSKVYIEGYISSDKWVDKENIERTSYSIIIAPYNGDLQIVSSRGGGSESSYSQGNSQGKPSSSMPAEDNNEELEDELPF